MSRILETSPTIDMMKPANRALAAQLAKSAACSCSRLCPAKCLMIILIVAVFALCRPRLLAEIGLVEVRRAANQRARLSFDCFAIPPNRLV